MAKVIRRLATETSTPLVDAQQLFEHLSRDGITGNEWLVDHVHPSIRGHQQLAATLLDQLIDLGFVTPRDGWEARRERLFHQQFESLDPLYYVRGQQRLEGLRSWTKGQSNRIKPASG